MFKRIVFSATLAGAFAGLVLTGVQQIEVIPTLLEAEAYEAVANRALSLEPASLSARQAGAEQAHQALTPESGWQRTALTAVCNILLGVGLALVLGAVISLHGEVSWRTGWRWGMGGYAVFFVAPALGLPPEVPGTEAAQLVDRQLWWLMTVGLSALGLWLVVFGHLWTFKLVGVVLLAIPHLIGAPQPDIPGGAAPPELAQAFIRATFLANALFWLVLGGLFGGFYNATNQPNESE